MVIRTIRNRLTVILTKKPARNLIAFCIACSYALCVAQVSGQDWSADAHIHHGLAYNEDGLQMEHWVYFEQSNIRVIGYPMPIKRDQHDSLLSTVQSEMEDLQHLSSQVPTFMVAEKHEDLMRHPSEDGIVIVPGIEYFHGVFGGDWATVAEYGSLGIRYITLIDHETDKLFDNGLITSFGEKVISLMNENRILIDISHLSEEEALQVIRLSSSPVIASHSSATAISDNPVSLSEDVLDALAGNGGYVFTTFNKNDLYRRTDQSNDGVNRFVQHVVYLVRKIGHCHVGIGSDYQALGRYVPSSLNEVNTYSQIWSGLKAAGFSAEDIACVSHGAFLNALGHTTRQSK